MPLITPCNFFLLKRFFFLKREMYMRLTFVTFSYFLNVLGSNVAFKGNTTWVMRVCVFYVGPLLGIVILKSRGICCYSLSSRMCYRSLRVVFLFLSLFFFYASMLLKKRKKCDP